MEEEIIKWSSKKIIWTIVLCFLELAFLLWILSFMMTYPKEAPVGLVALRLFVLFLIIIVGWILYERLRLLFSDKEYLKPCPTLSESGASNKIVNAIKNLKAKRRKDFIKRAIVIDLIRSLGLSFQGFFLFLFSKNYGIIGSKNLKRKKCYELKRLHCKY